jgi:hypothetical protein
MRAKVFSKALVGAVCAILLVGSDGAAIAAPSAVGSCDPENLNTRGDIDGDGGSDAVVGMPWQSDGAGAVDVRATGNPSVLLTAHSVGGGTGEGDQFGAAIAVADLDGDGCADLVIGAPAEGQSAVSDGAGDNEGQVHIVFGGPGGVDTSTSMTLPHDSSNLDHFGITLALVARGEGTGRVHDLYVGAPRATVGGHILAGEVFRYTLTPDPAKRVVATLREVRDQDSPGVPGSSEQADGFGSVLTALDDGGVLVGAPEEDIGSVRDAGAAWFLRVDAAGQPIASQSWSQDSPGVTGDPEAGDHFGAAIGARGSIAVVGVPDEDDGSKADSGMVQVLVPAGGNSGLRPARSITQNTAGVPGTLEPGDRFGAAVVVGTAVLCQESLDFAVGSPGEDIGTRANAGSVTLIALFEDLGCPATVLRQGAGLAGGAEAGDEVGSVLGLTRGRIDLDEDYADRLLIGVPREDLGAVADAGMVQPARGGIYSNGVASTTLQFSQGYLFARGYGLVLSSPSD